MQKRFPVLSWPIEDDGTVSKIPHKNEKLKCEKETFEGEMIKLEKMV